MTMNESFYDFLEEADTPARDVSAEFTVTDIATADWCLRKVEAAERRIQTRRDFVTAYRAKLDAWLEKANAADLATTERMAEHLRPYVEKEIAGQKRQSISLPTGTVGFRKSPDSLEVTDSAAAVASLKEMGANYLVRVKEEVDKRGVMESLKKGAPLPDGCELRNGERKFYMKVGEPE